MAFGLMNFNTNSLALEQQATKEILACNHFSSAYGLTLAPDQATALVAHRRQTLTACGRVELGPGLFQKLIQTFAPSPYLDPQNYADTLEALLDLFYEYKNESMDKVGDDVLLSYMQRAFDGICQGSLELLGGRELEQYARQLRKGGRILPEEGTHGRP